MSSNTFPIVDAHAHLFTRDMPLNDQPRHRPSYDFTCENYLATLDKHGVRYGVIAAASQYELKGTPVHRPGV